MTLCVYEYENITPSGEPIEPPQTRTPALALGAPGLRLSAQTVYVAVTSTTDCNIRLSTDGVAATTADHKITANTAAAGFAVRKNAKPYIYGV